MYFETRLGVTPTNTNIKVVYSPRFLAKIASGQASPVHNHHYYGRTFTFLSVCAHTFIQSMFHLVPYIKPSTALLLTLAILTSFTACVNTSPYSEFVKTVKFSSLDTFSFKHTLITGMDFRESEEFLLEELSKRVIVEELQLRGFEHDPTAADFFAVVKWKKSVSIHANPYDHIDPYNRLIDRRDDPASRFALRLHLTLEIYENSTRNLFWRNELPNIFDALQLTEKRVTNSLKLAIKKFPQHIVKDPNLPSIQ